MNRTIIYSTLLMLLATLSSCNNAASEAASGDSSTGGESQEANGKKAPNPVEVLEGQVAAERQLRAEVEERVAGEVETRERWEFAAIGLAFLAVIGFIAGTSIGSRGSRHAGA
ncbi:hypothetical protein BH23VER1_BH23VER1_32600 [soil metagenome]